ncbi:hypothetical protein [Rhodopirellula sp. SWK7]|uniref:hypothetical protein n=1 Tax=Rhodopirellula sp. SWK7 TaxID=595460 RepID=UPI0002BFC8A7|nr:hypothetical protein [Rhodopirellula sp. SWK7]EMI40948.1 putative membrane protein [Rhodopirellula sp. SWK7]
MIPLPRRAIGVLFGFAFLTSAAYVLTSSIGMSLYLARVGSHALPLVLVASAVVVVIVSMLTFVLINVTAPRHCIVAIWSLLATASTYLSWELTESHHSVFVLGMIYVLAEVRGCLNTVFLTTLMTDWFRNSESKRPYTLVAAGAPVAGIAAGLFLTWEASVLGNVRILQVIAALDLAVAVLAWSLPRRASQPPTEQPNTSHPQNQNGSETTASLNPSCDTPTQESNGKDQAPTKASSLSEASVPPKPSWSLLQFRSHLLVLMVVQTAVLTLIGYQWKVSVSDYWHEDESSLITYFAAYYAIVDTLILTSQLFIAGRLLDRFSVGMALRVYPLLLAITAAAAFFVNSVFALMIIFTFARGLDVFRRSLHDPALASAFAILSKRFRRQSIVVIKGIAKPTAEVISAMALFLYAATSSSNQITAVWLLLLIPWVLSATVAGKIHGQYDSS